MHKKIETLENILRIEEIRDRMKLAGWGREDLQKAEETLRSLRNSVGEGVRKSQAAEMLGVSRQTLDRWISEGVLPVVTSAGGQIEVSRKYLESLVPRVRQLRKDGRGENVLRHLRRLTPYGQTTKKATAKKTGTKKSGATTKKSTAKKTTAKKPAKATAKKPASKKTTKKTTAKKPAKATAKKPASKKTAAKKTSRKS
jgi:excisionase family DNA binding protein